MTKGCIYRLAVSTCLSVLPCLTIQAAPSIEPVIVFVGARIYPSPTDKPVAKGVVIVADGKIAAVGEQGHVTIPPLAQVIDCQGMSLTSGFWNSHVHFIERKWGDSAGLPASKLTSQLEEMLTRYGFVHVFETATFNLEHTLALRRRILSGEVAGPSIYTTGVPFAPPDGTPVYLAPLKLPELSAPERAESFVREQISAGADGVKFFAASPVSWTKVVAMPIDVAKAAVSAAHELKKPVFAHPTTTAGVRIAAESGVDVLAHTSPDGLEKWDESLVQQLLASRVALIPTLKLYQWDPARQGVPTPMIERVVTAAVDQLRQYSLAGGEILFGTDVGYMTDYDPEQEYLLMQRAGLDFAQILASLTTAPSSRFGASEHTGRISVGMAADLVVLAGDPQADLKALTAVRYAFRKGRLLYSSM